MTHNELVDETDRALATIGVVIEATIVVIRVEEVIVVQVVVIILEEVVVVEVVVTVVVWRVELSVTPDQVAPGVATIQVFG